MRLEVSSLPSTKAVFIEENINFDKEKFPRNFPLVEVLDTNVQLEVHKYEDFIDVFVTLTSNVILTCSYTLENFKSKIVGEEEYRFSCYDDLIDDAILYRGNFIELDELLYNLLSASVPYAPVKPGAKPPKSGVDGDITTEADLRKEKENSYDPRWDALADLEFDE